MLDIVQVADFAEKNITTAEQLAVILGRLGIKATTYKSFAKCECSVCHELKVPIVVENRREKMTWNCRKCVSRFRFHNTITGFIHSHKGYHKPLNELGAMIIDAMFPTLTPTAIRFPLNVANYKLRPLHELPPSLILWAIWKSEELSEDERNEFKQYMAKQRLTPTAPKSSSVKTKEIEPEQGPEADIKYGSAPATSFSRPHFQRKG